MSVKNTLFFLHDTLIGRRSFQLTPERFAFYRLLEKPRWKKGQIRLGGRLIRYVDAASCFSAWQAIFENHCYRFECDTETPTVIDLGANIGVSLLYFRSLFPDANLVGYEADPDIFQLLRKNCDGMNNVELFQNAVAPVDGDVSFYASGDDAGSLTKKTAAQPTTQHVISACRLSDILDRFAHVDLLKIDIEGAEVDVIMEAGQALSKVDRLFVEYHSFPCESQRLGQLLTLLQESGLRYLPQCEYQVRSPFLGFPTEAGMDVRTNVFAVREHLLGNKV